jgi:rhamnogalacturonyl hydrolase YesR
MWVAALAAFAFLAPGCQSNGGGASGTTISGGKTGSGGGTSAGGATGGRGSDATATAVTGGGVGGSGGNPTGGVTGTGGVAVSGGTSEIAFSGGAGGTLPVTGGATSNGGTTSLGGSNATGGTTGSGGITGSSGGTTSLGGGKATGGATGSGGIMGGTGGTTSLGGSKATGGATGSGGIMGGAGGLGGGGAGGKTGTGASAGSAGTGSGGRTGGSSGSLGWAVRMANSVLARHPNPDTIASSNFSWEVGYAMWTLEKVWRATQDPKYYSYIKKYVDQHVDATGKLSGFSASRLDDFLPGYAILLLYEQTQLQQYLTAATTIRNAFKTYPRNSDNGFWHSTGNPNQMWVDGVFMGQMFLARYGHATGESAAFDEVVTQMTDIVNHCMKTNGLLLHAYDESKKASWANPTTGLAPEVWSEGLGWYAVLIADVFDYLPADHPGRAGLMTILGQLTAGLKANQDAKSGRWCQVVDKCTLADDWDESSGTGMFLYLTKKSIDKGYIDATTYGPVVSSAYQGLVQKATVNSDSTIDINDCSSIGVQGSYSAYVSKAKQVSPPSCVSSFIAGTLMVEGPSFTTP